MRSTFRVILLAFLSQFLTACPNTKVNVGDFLSDLFAEPVVISQSTSQPDPATALPVSFTVQFNEPIDPATFVVDDISERGSADGVQWKIIPVGLSNKIFTIQAIAASTDGVIEPSIAAGLVTAADGSLFPASSATDNSVTLNLPARSIQVVQDDVQSDPTNVPLIRYTVIFSEAPLAGTFANDDLSVTTDLPTGITWGVTPDAGGDPRIYSVTASFSWGADSSNRTIELDVLGAGIQTDANPAMTFANSTAVDNVVTYDVVFPEAGVSISTDQTDPVDSLSAGVEFLIEFNEAINPDTLTVSDFANFGTLSGVTFELEHISDKKIFLLRAISASGTTGTIEPNLNVAGGADYADLAGNITTWPFANGNNFDSDYSVAYDNGDVPTVQSVNIDGGIYPDGTYTAGQTLQVKVVFNEDVVVSSVSNARLQLELGATDDYLIGNYLAGNRTLVFDYTVTSDDESLDLDYFSNSALSLVGGATIKDIGGNDADLSLPTPGSPGSIAVSRAIQILGTPAMLAYNVAGGTFSFSSTYLANSSKQSFSVPITHAGMIGASSVSYAWASGGTEGFQFVTGGAPGDSGRCGASAIATDCDLVIEFSPPSDGLHEDDLVITYFNGISSPSITLHVQGFSNPQPTVNYADCFRVAYQGEPYNCGATSTNTFDSDPVSGQSDAANLNWRLDANTCVGININSTTGIITGSPTVMGDCSFKIVVNDGVSDSNAWPVVVMVKGNSGIMDLSSGGNQSCGIVGGKVRCWGRTGASTTEAALGDGTTGSKAIPIPRAVLIDTSDDPIVDARQVAMSSYGHGCVRLADRSLRCWGNNDYGQIGDGTVTARLKSVGSGPSDVQQVAVGQAFSCALLDALSGSRGQVKCWGYNMYGRLGDGTSISRSSPVSVLKSAGTALTDIVQIGMGMDHVCALAGDGAVWCWGSGAAGKLGVENTVIQYYASKVMGFGPGAKRATYLAVGATHNCAMTDEDRVYCWGANTSGQLGLGDSGAATHRGDQAGEMTSLPDLTFAGGGSARVIAAGSSRTCAKLLDSSLRCWGSNANYALGIGSTDTLRADAGASDLDVNLGTSRSAQMVSIGESHSCVLRDNQSVVCFGNNSSRELGLDTGLTIGGSAAQMGDALVSVRFGKYDTSGGYLMFTTSNAFDGNLAGGVPGQGVPNADQKCQQRAQAAGVPNPLSFKAILSDSSLAGAQRAVGTRLSLTSGKSVYNTLGEVVTGDVTNLWSGLASDFLVGKLDYNENSGEVSTISGKEVFTGSSGGGGFIGSTADCQGWNSASNVAYGRMGYSDMRNQSWINSATNGTCDIPRHLYCIGTP